MEAHAFDAAVLVAGGDKVTPGMIMGALRTGVPGVYLYAGTTEVGRYRGRAVSWETVFEAIGERQARRDRRRRRGWVGRGADAGPGRGASAYTGNTMAMVAEALGCGRSHVLDRGGGVKRASFAWRGRPAPRASRLSTNSARSETS